MRKVVCGVAIVVVMLLLGNMISAGANEFAIQGQSISEQDYANFMRNLVVKLNEKPINAAETCVAMTTSIYGNGLSATGTASVSNDSSNLYVNFLADTESNWFIKNIQVYASQSPVPVTQAGAGDFDSFPLKDNFSSPQAAFAYTIPLTGLACGAELNVAAHLTMVQMNGNTQIAEESSWVVGVNGFPDGNGSYLSYQVCCSAPIEYGCTRAPAYWKLHHKFAVRPRFRIPWPVSENTQLCGKTWLTHMLTNSNGDNKWSRLADQWIAASLNVANEASSTPMVDDALAKAEIILKNHCRGIPNNKRKEVRQHIEILRHYNLGKTGPGRCSGADDE